VAIQVGDAVARTFAVDAATMSWFREVAEDSSRIHCDSAYAKARGYADVVVYGGILMAHLSHLLGMGIPGSNGTSIAWSIKFHEPLYVAEEAQIRLEVTYVSVATGVVEAKFTVTAGEKRVASGTTQSLVPLEQIQA
jgi:acyl dehydratase